MHWRSSILSRFVDSCSFRRQTRKQHDSRGDHRLPLSLGTVWSTRVTVCGAGSLHFRGNPSPSTFRTSTGAVAARPRRRHLRRRVDRERQTYLTTEDPHFARETEEKHLLWRRARLPLPKETQMRCNFDFGITRHLLPTEDDQHHTRGPPLSRKRYGASRQVKRLPAYARR